MRRGLMRRRLMRRRLMRCLPAAVLVTLAAWCLGGPAAGQAQEDQQVPPVEDVTAVSDAPSAQLSVMERIEGLAAAAAVGPTTGLPASAAEVRGATERFRDFVDLYRQYLVENFPETAPALGETTGQDRWTDISIAALNRYRRDGERCLAVLDAVDRSELEIDARLDYDLLRRRFEEFLRGETFSGNLMPVNQIGGLQQEIPQTLEGMPRRTVDDYENILARLEAVPGLIDDVMVRLRRGLSRGVTPPRVTLREVPQQFLDLLADEPLESPLLLAFRDFSDSIPVAEQERLRQAASAVYTDRVESAVRKIHQYLTLTYLPGARDTIAMRDLPDGAAWYAHLAASYTTTDLTPQAVHDLGLKEVERLRAEMEKVMSEIGFRGDFDAFNEFLRSHSGFFYDTADEMLRDYRDIAKRADGALPGLFGHLPRMPYGVKPMPSYAAASQTAAYYDAGSMQTGRSATFYVNTFDLKSRPKWRMEALTLHEAVPGHHLQVAIAHEQEDLPWFRRLWGYSAYVEGWALYAESLGYEMGFYEDPYQRLGQLTGEMWRALRLVVDTGLHQFGWSRQRAIDYMLRNAGRPEHEVTVEVDRYIVWPGQALAYKVGELRIREIRARAEQELGARFDLRAFHDALLADGALPLDVLEKKMDAWMAEQR